MEVLYDVSSLKGLLSDRRGLTGVPRVVESVLHALLDRDEDCRLTVCAPSFPHVGRAYFKRDLASKGARLAPTPADELPGRWIGELDWWLLSSHARRRALPWRLLRRLGLPLLGRSRPHLGRLAAETLQKSQIYHSPHGPIPADVRVRRAAHRLPQVALTVYDLIPFRHPEFFLPGMAAAQSAILKTTRPEEDWYLCISECTKRDLCELFGVDPQRVFVTPLAADTTVFHPCQPEVVEATCARYGLAREAPYLMSLCTLEPRKNVVAIIEAFAELARTNEVPGLQLLLVGGQGWLDENLRAVLERNGDVRERIILPGFVPDQDLAPLYSGALAFAYLSYYEGFGLPPLEAMQCGTPVLVSNTSSLAEVVGDAGLLFPPRDIDGIIQSLISLWRDSASRAERGLQSLKRARTFSWARCAQETLAAYRTMLAAGAS